jgi:hypothetical protein
MALNPQALQALMVSQLASKGIRGSKMSSFAGGVSEGIVESFLAQNIVNTIDSGLLPAGAPGAGIGKMAGLNPKAMMGMMLPLVASEGILGVKSKDLVEAICTAICNHFLAANLANTIHPLVAIGAGTGTVMGLIPEATTAIMVTKLASKGIRGTKMQGLAKGISTGFVNNVMATAVVTQTIAGSPLLILGSPVPSGGPGNGKIS